MLIARDARQRQIVQNRGAASHTRSNVVNVKRGLLIRLWQLAVLAIVPSAGADEANETR